MENKVFKFDYKIDNKQYIVTFIISNSEISSWSLRKYKNNKYLCHLKYNDMYDIKKNMDSLINILIVVFNVDVYLFEKMMNSVSEDSFFSTVIFRMAEKSSNYRAKAKKRIISKILNE